MTLNNLILPVQQAARGSVLSYQNPFSVDLTKDDRPRILLISDQINSSFSMAAESLEPEFRLYAAENSEQGIQYLEKNCPDLILCDLQRNRIENLISALKQAEFCDIPLILLTSPDQKYKASELLGDGISDYITKPYEKEELQIRVRNHLFQARAKKVLKSELHQEGKNESKHIDELANLLIEKNHELDRLNRTKDEFFAVLSHELRNPINVISGFAEILKTDEETSDIGRKAADAIYRSAQMQVKLITDLLEVSKGIAGKIILDCCPMDIKNLMEETLPAVLESAKTKNIKVIFTSDGHTGVVHGDSIRLSQVFWNLLTNAIKFTPVSGQIEIRMARIDQWVSLSIQDTGPGIDPAFIPQMFERFHQQDHGITKHYGGLGLGLAIVRHIVELHGGTVVATSEGLGKGATFTVKLPALPN
jgi:signal transduction histidine kinase